MKPIVHVIIPAFNEVSSIGKVVDAIPKEVVDKIIVVDNASTDKTAEVARRSGATVVHEHQRGYGNACLAGITYSRSFSQPPDIIVFLDGDFSDYPEDIPSLIAPIANNRVDLVIGSRTVGNKEPGSMTPQQVFGNWLATRLLRLLFNARFTDLGPFRAIRLTSLVELDMKDRTYGWTVEMQIKAAKMKLRFMEVPVRYRKRIGVSKISGTVKGTIMAGYKIMHTLFRYL